MHDKQPHHGDSRPTSRGLRSPLILVLRNDHGDDNVACGHCDGSVSIAVESMYFGSGLTADGSHGKDRLPAHPVNVQNSWNSG